MTAAINSKSASITNLDATPVVFNVTGSGAAGDLRSVSDYVTPGNTAGIGSQLRIVRFPTNAKIKHLWIWQDLEGTQGDFDIDVAFSDSTVDGTTNLNQGTIPQLNSADNKLFGAAVDLHDSLTPVDYVVNMVTNAYANGGSSAAQPSREIPMWQVLNFSDDPGGYFDILLKATNEYEQNSNVPSIYVELEFVE